MDTILCFAREIDESKLEVYNISLTDQHFRFS